MITPDELKQAGFIHNPEYGNSYFKENVKVNLNDGLVDYISQGENYHGIEIKPVDNIGKLNFIYSMLFE